MDFGLLQEQSPWPVVTQQFECYWKNLTYAIANVHQTPERTLCLSSILTYLDLKRINISLSQAPYSDLIKKARIMAELLKAILQTLPSAIVTLR